MLVTKTYTTQGLDADLYPNALRIRYFLSDPDLKDPLGKILEFPKQNKRIRIQEQVKNIKISWIRIR
jgi:hypothetical protein